jgi:hypothetical protein
VRVQLGALAPYLRGEWQLAEEATLGELTIRILAERFVDRTRATAIAAGWDGDRMIALTHDDAMAVVWLTAWDQRGRRGGVRHGLDGDRREPSSRKGVDAPRRRRARRRRPVLRRASRDQSSLDRGPARLRARRARRSHLAPQLVRAERAVGADRRGAHGVATRGRDDARRRDRARAGSGAVSPSSHWR